MIGAGVDPRAPYKVTYFKDGERHVIRRIPPVQLHKIRPGEAVTIDLKKNDDWDKGDEVKVKAISPRQPNVLHVEDEDGRTTFLDYFDVVRHGTEKELDRMEQEEAARKADPIGSKYLLWP